MDTDIRYQDIWVWADKGIVREDRTIEVLLVDKGYVYVRNARPDGMGRHGTTQPKRSAFHDPPQNTGYRLVSRVAPPVAGTPSLLAIALTPEGQLLATIESELLETLPMGGRLLLGALDIIMGQVRAHYLSRARVTPDEVVKAKGPS